MTITQPLQNVEKKVNHLLYLDSLRGLAALYVAMEHANKIFRPDIWNLPLAITNFNQIFVGGHYAVDLFIILSGFCLMLPVIRNDGKLPGGIIVFFKKRARRILPPYYISMGLSLVLIATVIGYKTGTIWDITFPVTPKDIITHLILIQDFFNDTNLKINGVFWSISVEWGIYLLFPLILISWKKFGGLTTTAVTIFLSNLLYFPLKLLHLNTSPWGICPHYFGLFALGMLGVEIIFSQQYVYTYARRNMPWKLMTVIFAGVAIIAYNLKFNTILFPLCDLTAGICFLCLLISIASSQKSWFYQILVCKPLVLIGTFSYSIYLINLPLEQLLHQYIIKPLNLTSFMSTSILSV